MRVAVPLFGSRVSPRFDCAQVILFVVSDDETVAQRTELSASAWTPQERIHRLVQMGVETVVCGGIDRWSAESLRDAGIIIHDSITGEADEVLAALLRGELEEWKRHRNPMMAHHALPIHAQLSPVALERFEHPRHYGRLAEFNGCARITGPCGDTMEFWVQVLRDRLDRIGFTTTGCGPSRAAGSMATELAVGKSLEESQQIEQADILQALGGLPKESEHCALLAANTLKAALRDFACRREEVRPFSDPSSAPLTRGAEAPTSNRVR